MRVNVPLDPTRTGREAETLECSLKKLIVGQDEAIQQIVSADHAPGTIIAEVQPGYMQGDRLVRAAMVVVTTAPSVTA